MNKITRKSIIIISLCVLAAVYIARVSYINIVDGSTNIVQCKVGEKISENAYEYQVTKYFILTEHEFEEKYDLDIPDDVFENYSDEKILTVNMNISQIDCDDNSTYKFDLGNLFAQTTTYSQGVGLNLFSLINFDNTVLEKTGDKISVVLPYVFIKDVFSDLHWNNFKENSLKISFSNAEDSKKEIILQ